MINKLRSKQQAKEAPVAPSLADRIKETCGLAEQYIESKVRELKATPDAALLPIDWLRQDLKTRHGGNCSCRVALALLAKDQPNGQ